MSYARAGCGCAVLRECGARTAHSRGMHATRRAAPKNTTTAHRPDRPTDPPAPRGLPLPSHPVGGPGPRAPGPWAGARRRAECGAPRRGGAGAGLGAGAVLSLNLRFILV